MFSVMHLMALSLHYDDAFVWRNFVAFLLSPVQYSHNLFFNTLQNVDDIVIIHYSNNYICNG